MQHPGETLTETRRCSGDHSYLPVEPEQGQWVVMSRINTGAGSNGVRHGFERYDTRSNMSVSRRSVRKCIETVDRYVYMSMNAISPAPHRHRRGSLVQFAVAVTAAAAILAWFLAAVAHFSETAVVVTVMTVAFAASWIVTNHRPAQTHRVSVVPARVRTH